MYGFYYNYIKENYNDNAQILYTDTDSLTYTIKTEDIYKDFWPGKDKFDFSKYSDNKSEFYDIINKKVIGKFKDKTEVIPFTEFVGLKFKTYSYILNNDNAGKKAAKGIKKMLLKKSLKIKNIKTRYLIVPVCFIKQKHLEVCLMKFMQWKLKKIFVLF